MIKERSGKRIGKDTKRRAKRGEGQEIRNKGEGTKTSHRRERIKGEGERK